MSETFCISCDLEACNHQLHFNTMLSRPHDRLLSDDWLTMIKGDPQTHTARHFCSYLCLSEWISLEREEERKAEQEKLQKQRRLTLILRYAPDQSLSGYIHARARTVYELFFHQFPESKELNEIVQDAREINVTDWKYSLSDAQDEHIEWAKLAKECGLIDYYTVDEGTS